MSLPLVYSTCLQVSVVVYETHPQLGLIYEAEFYRTFGLELHAVPAQDQNGYQNEITTDHRQEYSLLSPLNLF